MRTLINSLHPDDYNDMMEENEELQKVCQIFHSNNLNIEIPHHHRYWEYATVLHMLRNYVVFDTKVMDVGSGHGLMGPALSYLHEVNVTECEPTDYAHRVQTNAYLTSQGKPEIRVIPCGTDNLPDEQFDMVSCISVIEHMHADVESRCWKNLIDRIKPGGLFFADVDCVENPNIPHIYDNLRVHNFTIPELKDRVDNLIALGMEPLGEPDYNWNGAQVFDFTFFRIGMRKVI
jgi:SAM-dependent methyltransferase